MKPADKIREYVKNESNEKLLEAWKSSRKDLSVPGIAVNAIMETELEQRGLIKLNEDTYEYEIMR